MFARGSIGWVSVFGGSGERKAPSSLQNLMKRFVRLVVCMRFNWVVQRRDGKQVPGKIKHKKEKT